MAADDDKPPLPLPLLIGGGAVALLIVVVVLQWIVNAVVGVVKFGLIAVILIAVVGGIMSAKSHRTRQ